MPQQFPNFLNHRQASHAGSHKSFTGNHDLITEERSTFVHPIMAGDEPFAGVWTVGRGTVIWRIWPAVLLHTIFAAAIVTVSHKTRYNLAINSALLVVVGVVIGFVISYRASSGYDRYSQGRAMWGDVIKQCRSMSRLVWIHVPPKLVKDRDATEEEIRLAIAEKQAILSLIEGFAVAVKHHLRGETGIYYADLYYLLLPLHRGTDSATATIDSINGPPLIMSPPPGQVSFPAAPPPAINTTGASGPSGETNGDYGTFVTLPNSAERRPLLPPTPIARDETVGEAVSYSMIPWFSTLRWFWGVFTLKSFARLREVEEADRRQNSTPYSHRRHRPRVAGRGGGLPLAVVRAIGEWVALLDSRGTASGMAIGQMMGGLTMMESCLTDLERVLTSPLPVIYSAHLRHTIWLYLFFLPFQLTEPLGYLAILAVAIAAFLYLGFLAAGEELEEPFGYEENDLDQDLFIRAIIHQDIDAMLAMSTPNTYTALKAKLDSDNHSQGLVADTCREHLAKRGGDGLGLGLAKDTGKGLDENGGFTS